MPYSVKVGKQTVSCHRLKRVAKKSANALKAAGRKNVRLQKRESCR